MATLRPLLLFVLLAVSRSPPVTALIAKPVAIPLRDLGTRSHVVTFSPKEKATCSPLPSTINEAKSVLQDFGFVVLRANGGLIDSQLVNQARLEAEEELDLVLGRLRKVRLTSYGADPLRIIFEAS